MHSKLFFALLILAAIALSCGSSSHIPQSVTLTPASATATNGSVQFTATVTYNTMPSPVTNPPATWGACVGNANVNGVSVSTTGLAQCSQGANQSYTIYAFVPDPDFKGVCAGGAEQLPCGGSCGGVVGTAQLTCP